jgi:hypothetical protein
MSALSDLKKEVVAAGVCANTKCKAQSDLVAYKSESGWICLCLKCRARRYEESRKVILDAKKPHRKTLVRKIEQLESEVKRLKEVIDGLKGKRKG